MILVFDVSELNNGWHVFFCEGASGIRVYVIG